ncbi:hypothetical protein [uncultured Paraglaciecola sp.]|uniref:hypothetical protein n=1 Tax=uncultured Paraglaciecola sp. TaxID=1765024 RepID=UPI0030D8688C|tara:strand:+ start:6563 stop:6853 length:291 start_codon:yes stop_codon:yes gene_type:complete
MIFGKMEYENDYSDFHDELVNYLKTRFEPVKSGLQGDSWIEISENNETVTVDTFLSMKHQIKSSKVDSTLVKMVIDYLCLKYKVVVFSSPEIEPHE